MQQATFFKRLEKAYPLTQQTQRYGKKQFPKDVEETIALADQIAQNAFVFTLRWDMEKTSKPVRFPNTIDWLYQPGDDPEFIFAFNRMRFWVTLGQAYVLTGNETYAKAFVSQAESWIHTVKRDDPASANAWRTIEAGIRMENWMKAIRYFQGSPALTDDFLDLFSQSMRVHMRFIMGVWNSFNMLSNWGVLANHGLFMASTLLPQDEETTKATAEAIRRLWEELSMQVYDDGVQWEQSAMYHNEVLHDYLDVLWVAKKLGVPLPQAFTNRVHKMAQAAAAWQKPDGTEPLSGDSDRIDQRDLMEKAAVIFSDPALRAKGEAHLCFDAFWEVGLAGERSYQKLPKAHTDPLLLALSDAGQVYYQKNGTYLRFKAGTLGAGHGHADQLHLDLFAQGEDILVDAGRYTYVPKPDRYVFKDDAAHNLVTVDGKNSYVCQDSWSYSKMSKAYGLKWNEKNGLCLFQAGHLGYYQDGVFISRSVIVLSPTRFVIVDRLYGDKPHTMEAHFHFHPRGTVETNPNRFHYTGKKANVWFSAINAEQLTLSDSRYSERYNEEQPNKAVTAMRHIGRFGSIITVVAIGTPAEIHKVPVKSTFKGTVFSDDQVEAVSVDGTIVVASHYEWGSPTDSFQVDGHVGWGQCVVFRPGDTNIGTVLEY
jgi:hypothetical protein